MRYRGGRTLWTGDKHKGAKSQRRDSPWHIAQEREGQCLHWRVNQRSCDKVGEDMLNRIMGTLKAGLSLDFNLKAKEGF